MADAETKASAAQTEQEKAESSARPLRGQLEAAKQKISELEGTISEHVKAFSVAEKSLKDMTDKFNSKEGELHQHKESVKASMDYKDGEIKRLGETLTLLSNAVRAIADGTFGRYSLFIPARFLTCSFRC